MTTAARWLLVARVSRLAAGVGLLSAGFLKAWEPWLVAATMRRLVGVQSWLAVGAISAIEVLLALNLLLIGSRQWATVGGVVGAAFLGWRALTDSSMPCGCFGAVRGEGFALFVSALLASQGALAVVFEPAAPAASSGTRQRLAWLAALLALGITWSRFDGEELWQVVMRERGLFDGTVAVVDPDCSQCQQFVEAARWGGDLVLVVRQSAMDVARTAWRDVPCVGVSEAMWWQWCGEKPPAIYRIEAGRMRSPR